MNQDQVKEILLRLDPNVSDFSVVFSGKSSKKVNGLYKPETAEILIHNRNFEEDNALLYTAIHEFAHHVHFSRSDDDDKPTVRRSHTIAFRSILHTLLQKAEASDVYKNVFESDREFQDLTRKMKDQYLVKNGTLMKEFGKLLIEALDLCRRRQASFEDYVERTLGFNRSQAHTMMKVYAHDVDERIGYENMRIVAGVNDEERRSKVENILLTGGSQDEARAFVRASAPKPESTVNRLKSEKLRLEKTLETIQKRLEEVDHKLAEMTEE